MINLKPTQQLQDAFTDNYGLAREYWTLAARGLANGPFSLASNVRRYPWMLLLLRMIHMHRKMVSGRTGPNQQANADFLAEVVSSAVDYIGDAVKSPDNLVIHEDVVPPEIPIAMGLPTFCSEFLGYLAPLLNPVAMEPYIDACENDGIPPDTCSLPKCGMGVAASGHMPEAAAVITSNSPCDGGMASYTMMQKKTGVPVFWLDVPFNFTGDRAARYFAGELERMIHWLEEHTSGRMDWERLAEICEERNRMVTVEMELWDMLAHRPAPLAAEPIYMSHMWAYTVYPGSKRATRMFERLRDHAKNAIKTNRPAVPNEKHRALLWGPFPAHPLGIFKWAEKRYQTAMILDSLSFNRLPLIDVSTRQSMLEGLAWTIMHGPMARHSRGLAENYFNDLFFAVERFGIDMIWQSGHVGCKNSQALYQMLREKCREREIPLLIWEFDLADSRVVSEARMREQIDSFMENVMKA